MSSEPSDLKSELQELIQLKRQLDTRLDHLMFDLTQLDGRVGDLTREYRNLTEKLRELHVKNSVIYFN